ncbi:MAG: FecCD family ABC transporter permease [Bacillota bacterium]
MSKYTVFRTKNNSLSFLVDRKVVAVISTLACITILLSFISMGLGTTKVNMVEVIQSLFNKGTELQSLVIKIFRLPRIIIALLVGSSLALSGAILQGIIRNPLASPDIIGITGGASLGAVSFLAMYSDTNNNSLTVSINWLPAAAFLGASLIALLIYFVAWKNGVSPTRLILIGIGVSAAMQALTTIMIVFGPLYLATQATLWLTGSVYGSSWQYVNILLPWVIIIVPFVFISARKLNIQELGDEVSIGLGSKANKQRFIFLLMSTALAGGAVAFAGGISFVGLLAPHIARKLVGSAFGALLPASALIGGIIVLLADTVGRTAFLPLDIPAGVFTASIGAPYFIYLLYKK